MFFSGTELKLLRCYLRNREQCVKYNNYQSKLINISTGVPQGSILGPLLCFIYLITISDKLNFIMYADDTTIYFILEDFDLSCIEAEITNELEKVNIRLKLNKLSLKSWRSENHTPPPPIIIGLTKVNRNTSHENLRKKYFNSSFRNKFFMKLTT